MARKLLILILVINPSTCQSSVLCFYPDGSPATDFNYTPNPASTSKYKACCDESERDEFLPGGLCWFPSSPDHGPYPYRAACTDRSWKSPDCPSLCTLGTPNRWESLLFCPNSSTFCCQKAVEEGGSCCDDPKLALDVPEFPAHVMSTLSSLNPVQPTAPTAPDPYTISRDVSFSTTQVTKPTPSSQAQTAPSAATFSTEIATSASISLPPQQTSRSHDPALTTSDKITVGCAVGIGIPTLVITFIMCWRQKAIRVHIEHAVRRWWDDF